MKTTNNIPVFLDALINGRPIPTTTTKEPKVKTTTTTTTTDNWVPLVHQYNLDAVRKHTTTKPVVVEAVAEEVKATKADLTNLAVTETIKAESVISDAKAVTRSACIAVFNANEAGVSFRALELASSKAGTKVSKSAYARYAKAGAILVKDQSADPFEVLTKVNRAEQAKPKAKPETPETPETPEVGVLSGEAIVALLTEEGAVAIADITASLIASFGDDHQVFITLAVALLKASANTTPLDLEDRATRVDFLTALAETVNA